MVDIGVLKEKIFGLVGSRQSIGSDYDLLPDSLLESRSSKYVQSQHPILSIENIDQCAYNYSDEIYEDYNSLTEYVKGDRVADSGVNYEYYNPFPSTGVDTSDTDYWQPVSDLANYLIRRQEDAIEMVVQSMIDEKKLKSLTKSIYENILLFDGAGSLRNKEINEGKFVGLQITLKNHRSLTTVINAIKSQFSGVVSLPVYLYHSSKQSPLATFTINHSAANSSINTKLISDNVLRYLSDDYDIGGDFYLGYYQSNLSAVGVQAINKDWDWSKAPCGTCNGRNQYYYNSYSEFVGIVGIEVPSNYLNGTDLFDLDGIGYSYNKTYGLNLNLTTKCDITDFVVQEEYLLADAIVKQWAELLLEDIAFNLRDNAISPKVRQSAIFELQEKKGGIPHKRSNAIKALSFDFSELNDACLPCNDELGIKWGVI